MKKEEQLARLEAMRMELFTMANASALAEDKIYGLGMQLHKASNAVTRAVLIIEDDPEALASFDTSAELSASTEMMYNVLKMSSPEMFDN